MTVTKPRPKRRAVRPALIARAVDEGRESLDLYLDEISRVPLLTREQEMALARKAFRGDVEAQERLARHNVRFVVSVAKKFQNRGVPLVDLIGEGNLGLMTAARKFDPDRGVKFISYAVWWIRQAVQAAIARHGRPVRVPLNRTADLSVEVIGPDFEQPVARGLDRVVRFAGVPHGHESLDLEAIAPGDGHASGIVFAGRSLLRAGESTRDTGPAFRRLSLPLSSRDGFPFESRAQHLNPPATVGNPSHSCPHTRRRRAPTRSRVSAERSRLAFLSR